MRLVIQTNIPGQLEIWVLDSARRVLAHKTARIQFHGSDQLLELVDRTLRGARLGWADIRGIAVVRGPGPFTAVRTGVIVGNTLAMLLRIPVVGMIRPESITKDTISQIPWPKKQPGKFIRPSYGREPNITKPRAKARTLARA